MTCTGYFDYKAQSGKMHVSTFIFQSSAVNHHFMKPALHLKNSEYSGPAFKVTLRGSWTVLAAT